HNPVATGGVVVSTIEKFLLLVMIYLAVAGYVRVRDEHRWRESLVAFRLRLSHDVDVEQVGRWIGTLAAMTYTCWWFGIPRWWPLGIPRWPIIIELVATSHGVQRVLLVPSGMAGEIMSALAAVLPGLRADPLPEYHAQRQPLWRFATELRI